MDEVKYFIYKPYNTTVSLQRDVMCAKTERKFIDKQLPLKIIYVNIMVVLDLLLVVQLLL